MTVPLNPHNWLSRIGAPPTDHWECQYCHARGSYDELEALPCTYQYPPCQACGQTPLCAPDCRGIVQALESPDIDVISDYEDPSPNPSRPVVPLREIWFSFLREFADKNLWHYLVNFCLVKADLRSAMLIQDGDFQDAKILRKVLRWFRKAGPELYFIPLQHQTLIARYPVSPEAVDNAEWMGKTLGYACAGELDGNFAIELMGVYRKQAFQITVQRCRDLSKLQSVKNLARRIERLFKKHKIKLQTYVESTEFFTEDHLLAALQRYHVPQKMYPDLANYFWNWGFNRIARYIDLVNLNNLTISPKSCAVLLQLSQWIDQNKYSIHQFASKKEFREHGKKYQAQVDQLEKSIFDRHLLG